MLYAYKIQKQKKSQHLSLGLQITLLNFLCMDFFLQAWSKLVQMPQINFSLVDSPVEGKQSCIISVRNILGFKTKANFDLVFNVFGFHVLTLTR